VYLIISWHVVYPSDEMALWIIVHIKDSILGLGSWLCRDPWESCEGGSVMAIVPTNSDLGYVTSRYDWPTPRYDDLVYQVMISTETLTFDQWDNGCICKALDTTPMRATTTPHTHILPNKAPSSTPNWAAHFLASRPSRAACSWVNALRSRDIIDEHMLVVVKLWSKIIHCTTNKLDDETPTALTADCNLSPGSFLHNTMQTGSEENGGWQ
jgi:hypothetical protein